MNNNKLDAEQMRKHFPLYHDVTINTKFTLWERIKILFSGSIITKYSCRFCYVPSSNEIICLGQTTDVHIGKIPEYIPNANFVTMPEIYIDHEKTK